MAFSTDLQKQAAAHAALSYVELDMVVGLGTGSTATHFVRGLGERVADGLKVKGVATSLATAALARDCGIEVLDPDDVPAIDITVDGADELDDTLQLIKGAGAALLREKIIAASSARMVVIADASKHVKCLGAFPLPVEVVPFGAQTTRRRILTLLDQMGQTGAKVTVRMSESGDPVVTDGGHILLDCALKEIADAQALSHGLNDIPGVVDHGLFLGLATLALIGTGDGVTTLTPPL